MSYIYDIPYIYIWPEMAGKEELKEDGPGGKTMNLNWM